MASSRTNYPKFTEALYRMEQVLGEVRAPLKANAGFTTTDLAAFDALVSAVQTATAYFPQHTEVT